MPRFLFSGLILLMGWMTTATEGTSQAVAANLERESRSSSEASVLLKPARLTVSDVPLATAITELAESAEVGIAFSPSRLAKEGNVDCSDCADLTVGEALDHLLGATEYRYMEIDEHIVIIPRVVTQPAVPQEPLRPPPVRFVSLSPAPASRAAPAVVNKTSSSDGGAVTGRVTAGDTGEPLAMAQVHLEGTNRRALTNEEGRYLITNVPGGVYTVAATYLGYADGRQENIRVARGEVVEVHFRLNLTPLRLEGIVVTGVMDPTSGVKTPFVVGRVSAEDLAVPQLDAVGALRGRVAGVSMSRGGGQPGDDYDIILRSPTSIERSNAPMVVVDGVILGEASLRDFDGMDIESIEVVKGAAAASMYGSRAAAGVIAIQTRTGAHLREGETRFTFQTEIGRQEVPPDRIDRTQQYHPFLTNDDGDFINWDGEVVEPAFRVVKPDAIADQPYRETYDHFSSLIRPGTLHNSSLSMMQNAENTQFYASIRNTTESGIMRHNDGLRRRNFRLNLNHWPTGSLNLAASGYFSRTSRDEVADPNPFYDVMLMPPDVDLTAPDEEKDKKYVAIPQRGMHTRTNPLYSQYYNEAETETSRFLGGLTATYTPSTRLRVEGTLGFDRSDREAYSYWPVGFEQMLTDTKLFGEIDRRYRKRETLTAGLNTRLQHQLGRLTLRHYLRALYEIEDRESTTSIGRNLAAANVRNLSIAEEIRVRSSTQAIRSEGYSVATGFDYAGKFVGDVLFRVDGSSLFGPDDRWNPYYRISGAYRMTEERWWPFDAVTEFKPRYSIGTAGGRPSFYDRYETWTSITGQVQKQTLGNRLLRPEKATEQEVGLDVILWNRVSLQLTRAETKVEDQLLQMPLPNVIGYSHQWQNAATLEGTTYEATLEATLLSRPGRTWSVNMTWDRSRHMITEFPFACYTDSPTGSASRDVFYRCAGYSLSSIYGRPVLRSHAQLSAIHANSRDQFQVNDDGYLVPVGAGNNWTDGIAKGLWGTTVEIDSRLYEWGLPMSAIDDEGQPFRTELGYGEPDFQWAVGTRYRVGSFTFGGLLDGSVGGTVYNYERRRAYQDFHPDFDQGHKPDERKKPIHYYSRMVGNLAFFLEDATYMKLRELSATYRMDSPPFLQGYGIRRAELSLMARNLYTWTQYTGWDPEVGTLHRRIREGAYPHMRILSLGVRLDF